MTDLRAGTCCGLATLLGRRVWIVELTASELRRADEWAEAAMKSVRRYRRSEDDEDLRQQRMRDDATSYRHKALGAQAEIAVAKVLGVRAPLRVDAFKSAPDIPPYWSVSAQESSSKDMLARYLRIRGGSLHHGWRHVLVERDVTLWGGLVFIVHGWIADEQARRVSIRRYSYSANRFVHLRHLTPLSRELYDTAHGAPTDEPPPPAPADTDDDARLF